jgi:hypothetical protein
VLHPQRYGVQPIPWLVADGYMANYHEILDALPLILVTSKWVKSIYKRDGLSGKNIEVLSVGCDTDSFIPREKISKYFLSAVIPILLSHATRATRKLLQLEKHSALHRIR